MDCLKNLMTSSKGTNNGRVIYVFNHFAFLKLSKMNRQTKE